MEQRKEEKQEENRKKRQNVGNRWRREGRRRIDWGSEGNTFSSDFPGKNTGGVAISFSRGSSPPWGLNPSPVFQADSLPSEPPGKLLFFSNIVFLGRQYSRIYSSWTYCKNIPWKYLRSKAVRRSHLLRSRRYTKHHPMTFALLPGNEKGCLRFPRSLRICESHPTWTWTTLNGHNRRNTNLLNLPWQENLTCEGLWFPLQSWITLQNSDENYQWFVTQFIAREKNQSCSLQGLNFEWGGWGVDLTMTWKCLNWLPGKSLYCCYHYCYYL